MVRWSQEVLSLNSLHLFLEQYNVPRDGGNSGIYKEDHEEKHNLGEQLGMPKLGRIFQ